MFLFLYIIVFTAIFTEIEFSLNSREQSLNRSYLLLEFSWFMPLATT